MFKDKTLANFCGSISGRIVVNSDMIWEGEERVLKTKDILLKTRLLSIIQIYFRIFKYNVMKMFCVFGIMPGIRNLYSAKTNA